MKKHYFLFLFLMASLTYAQDRDVTFSVDMSGYSGSFTTVYVSGTLNGWAGTANALTDQGGGIWSGTIQLAEGTYEYKFTIDDWAAQETFSAGSVCTVTNDGFTNRFLDVGDSNIVLSTPMFGACFETTDGNDGPHDITLEVDMSAYSGTFTTAYVSGAFNGWAGTANPMTDQGGGIWSATISFTEGQHEYKFTVDDWADQENFNQGDAYTVTNGGFTNRFLLADQDKTLSYSWNNQSTLSVPEDDLIIGAKAFPNPTIGDWNITVSNSIIKRVQVFNLLGKKVMTVEDNDSETVIKSNQLPSGIYLARVETDKGNSTVKLIKN